MHLQNLHNVPFVTGGWHLPVFRHQGSLVPTNAFQWFLEQWERKVTGIPPTRAYSGVIGNESKRAPAGPRTRLRRSWPGGGLCSASTKPRTKAVASPASIGMPATR